MARAVAVARAKGSEIHHAPRSVQLGRAHLVDDEDAARVVAQGSGGLALAAVGGGVDDDAVRLGT